MIAERSGGSANSANGTASVLQVRDLRVHYHNRVGAVKAVNGVMAISPITKA